MDEIRFGAERGYSAPMGLMKIHSKAVLSRRVFNGGRRRFCTLVVAPVVSRAGHCTSRQSARFC
jgi:hypothetical protein